MNMYKISIPNYLAKFYSMSLFSLISDSDIK